MLQRRPRGSSYPEDGTSDPRCHELLNQDTRPILPIGWCEFVNPNLAVLAPFRRKDALRKSIYPKIGALQFSLFIKWLRSVNVDGRDHEEIEPCSNIASLHGDFFAIYGSDLFSQDSLQLSGTGNIRLQASGRYFPGILTTRFKAATGRL